MKVKLYIFALAASGQGISGGDRIFIELSRRWSKSFPIEIFVWKEGRQMCDRLGLIENDNLKITTVNLGIWSKLGFIICYLSRIVTGVVLAFGLNFQEGDFTSIIFSASEFWMDSIPAFILKLKNPKLFWVAAWYQTAPNLLQGFSQARKIKLSNLTVFPYWLTQLFMKPLISKYSDLILVNNEEEKKQFSSYEKQNKVHVLLGAVDLDKIKKYKNLNKSGSFDKKYDAVFQGRFHPQKGVVELIDIWSYVVGQKKDAKLAMIGDGPLMPDVKNKINQLGLESNIDLLGYLFDGSKKYETFSRSKLVVHPSLFDSGGMAAAEAMAFNMPGVAFDLQSYKSYYPQGMLKVPLKDNKKFAQAILSLLGDKNKYLKLQKQAMELIESKWDWNYRAKEVLSKIESSLKEK